MSSFDSDSSLSDDQLRPRLETYAGRELKPHRIRTNSNREMTRNNVRPIQNRQRQSLQQIPVRIGAFTSTESVFSSYVPITSLDNRPPVAQIGRDTSKRKPHQTSERDSETGEAVENLLHVEKQDSVTQTPASRNEEAATEGFEAWQVLFACTFSCILMGIDWVAFPVFYVHFAREYGVSQLTAGWVGSLQNAVSHILGIVVSAPIQIYGCKPVAVIGSVIAYIGLTASCLATSISFLYVSYGIVAGKCADFCFYFFLFF